MVYKKQPSKKAFLILFVLQLVEKMAISCTEWSMTIQKRVLSKIGNDKFQIRNIIVEILRNEAS